MTLLSTTSEDDLALNNNELVQFSRGLPGVPEAKYLGFANKWYIGSKSACSCEFRHLCVGSTELGLANPKTGFLKEPQK
jgi:hypothetical protein